MVRMLDNARHIAASALKKVAEDGAYSNIVLNNILSDAELSKEEIIKMGARSKEKAFEMFWDKL